jgi:hypothetical protein
MGLDDLGGKRNEYFVFDGQFWLLSSDCMQDNAQVGIYPPITIIISSGGSYALPYISRSVKPMLIAASEDAIGRIF